MPFIAGNYISDNTPITINTDHIVTVKPGYDGGTEFMMTTLNNAGSPYSITISQDYSTVSQDLQRISGR